MPLRRLTLSGLLAASCVVLPVHAQDLPSYLWGTSIEASEATRTITITPETRWVNVRLRESVRFVVGSTSFAWRFDGPGARAVDLQRIAPAGSVTSPVTVYIDTQGDTGRRA